MSDERGYCIALSGLQAAQTQLNVTAQNIANSDTPGYQAERVDLVDLSTGGVATAGISKDPRPGPISPDGTRGSNVDLGSEMLSLTRAKLLYSANAAVLKVGQPHDPGAFSICSTIRIITNNRNSGTHSRTGNLEPLPFTLHRCNLPCCKAIFPLPVRRGKVRDVYDLGDKLLISVASDRINVLPTA